MPSYPSSSSPPLPLATLEAVLERITYANEETGYTVARVSVRGSGSDLLTIVGNLLGAQPGESLRLHGRWKSHAQYGRQFEVANYTTILPATLQGIRRYLGSGLIKGIGPKMAERIVAHFELDTLRVIEEEPARLIEVPGLGPKRYRQDHRCLGGTESDQGSDGLPARSRRLDQPGSPHLQNVSGQLLSASSRTNPIGWPAMSGALASRRRTRLRRVWVSRQTVRSASKQGYSTPSPRRATRGIAICPEETLIADAGQILAVESSLIQPALEALIRRVASCADHSQCSAQLSVSESPRTRHPLSAVYLLPFYRAEVSLAKWLAAAARSSIGPAGFLPNGELGSGAGLAERARPERRSPQSRSRRCNWR